MLSNRSQWYWCFLKQRLQYRKKKPSEKQNSRPSANTRLTFLQKISMQVLQSSTMAFMFCYRIWFRQKQTIVAVMLIREIDGMAAPPAISPKIRSQSWFRQETTMFAPSEVPCPMIVRQWLSWIKSQNFSVSQKEKEKVEMPVYLLVTIGRKAKDFLYSVEQLRVVRKIKLSLTSGLQLRIPQIPLIWQICSERERLYLQKSLAVELIRRMNVWRQMRVSTTSKIHRKCIMCPILAQIHLTTRLVGLKDSSAAKLAVTFSLESSFSSQIALKFMTLLLEAVKSSLSMLFRIQTISSFILNIWYSTISIMTISRVATTPKTIRMTVLRRKKPVSSTPQLSIITELKFSQELAMGAIIARAFAVEALFWLSRQAFMIRFKLLRLSCRVWPSGLLIVEESRLQMSLERALLREICSLIRRVALQSKLREVRAVRVANLMIDCSFRLCLLKRLIRREFFSEKVLYCSTMKVKSARERTSSMIRMVNTSLSLL